MCESNSTYCKWPLIVKRNYFVKFSGSLYETESDRPLAYRYGCCFLYTEGEWERKIILMHLKTQDNSLQTRKNYRTRAKRNDTNETTESIPGTESHWPSKIGYLSTTFTCIIDLSGFNLFLVLGKVCVFPFLLLLLLMLFSSVVCVCLFTLCAAHHSVFAELKSKPNDVRVSMRVSMIFIS